MNKSNLRVLFMGTPDFAIPSLKAMMENFDVIGVVTQTDKPRGRGNTVQPTPIKVVALENDIPVYQPETFKEFAFADQLKALDPDVIAVVAYGKLLPEYVLNYPRFGCVNVHGSLLPQYRGAAPMQRAIIDGCKTTGITTQLMAKGLDTGDILEIEECEILPNDNFEDIHDKLSEIGARLLVSTIKGLENGTIIPQKQDDSLANYAAKIEKSDCKIDFSKSAQVIHNQIRGLSPIPVAFCKHGGKLLKILASEITDIPCEKYAPGEVISLDKGKICVACGDFAINVLAVIPEGKGKMKALDFINGRKISLGDILS